MVFPARPMECMKVSNYPQGKDLIIRPENTARNSIEALAEMIVLTISFSQCDATTPPFSLSLIVYFARRIN